MPENLIRHRHSLNDLLLELVSTPHRTANLRNMSPQEINWAIYHSLPLEQAQYQLAHIHESKKAEIATSYSICLPIAVVAIIMRFVSRRIGGTTYGADDWVIVVALVTHC